MVAARLRVLVRVLSLTLVVLRACVHSGGGLTSWGGRGAPALLWLEVVGGGLWRFAGGGDPAGVALLLLVHVGE